MRIWAMIVLSLGLAGCGESKPTPEPDPGPTPEFIEFSQPGISAMVIPAGAKPEQFEAWARAHCGALEFCQVMGWTDPARAARAFPMSDREVEAIAFSFKINRPNAFEQVIWDCKRFPQEDPQNCL